jgi:hypothetical protein
MSLSTFVRIHEIGFIREEINEISLHRSQILRDLRAMQTQAAEISGYAGLGKRAGGSAY